MYLCIHVFICACMEVRDNLWVYVFSFHHADCGEPISGLLLAQELFLTLLLLCAMSHRVFSEWSPGFLLFHHYSPRPEPTTTAEKPAMMVTTTQVFP